MQIHRSLFSRASNEIFNSEQEHENLIGGHATHTIVCSRNVTHALLLWALSKDFRMSNFHTWSGSAKLKPIAACEFTCSNNTHTHTTKMNVEHWQKYLHYGDQ